MLSEGKQPYPFNGNNGGKREAPLPAGRVMLSEAKQPYPFNGNNGGKREAPLPAAC